MAEQQFFDENKSIPLFSKSIKAGKRTYFIDVKSTRNNENYIVVTESKRLQSNDSTQEPVYERHKIFLYKEDFEKFANALHDAIEFIKQSEDEDFNTEI